MKHPLDGARLKTVRAQKHLSELNLEVRCYIATHPHEFVVEHEKDVLTAKPAIINVEPPLELGLIFGDCINNLRSSLDYIAWQLATKYHSTALVVGKDKIYFPLASDLAGYSQNGRAKLTKYSIPAPALDLIESVQPYHAGYESLTLLSGLGNEDKHQMPLLAFAQAETSSIDLTVIGKPIGQVFMHPPGSKAVLMGNNVFGMSVRRLTLDDLDEHGNLKPAKMFPAESRAPVPGVSEEESAQVTVDGQVTVFVTLKNSPMPLVPIDKTLEQIVATVADIIPRFDPFF